MKKLYPFIFIFSAPYIILFLNDCYFIPDWMGLGKINSRDYFELILNITSSIFGILIAVILLTFEFSKDNSLRRKGENIFDHRYVVYIVSLPISILILSFLSYILLENFDSGSALSVAYFIGLLLLVFVCMIFPATKSILAASDILKGVQDRIKSLTHRNFDEISPYADSTESVGQNLNIAMVRVRHDLIICVRQNDYEAYEALLDNLTKRMAELIGDGKDRNKVDKITEGFVFIIKRTILEARYADNVQFLSALWSTIDKIFKYSAQNKIPLLYYQPLEMFIPEYIRFLAKHNLGEVLSFALETISRSFFTQLKLNCPAQNGLSDLHSFFKKEQPDYRHDTDDSIQWDNMMGMIEWIFSIQQHSIDNADKELYASCNFKLENIYKSFRQEEFAHIESLQEAAISIRIISNQLFYAEMANDDGLFRSALFVYHINSIYISRLIEENKFYSKHLLVSIGNFILKMQRKAALEDSFLNSWGAIGRHLSKHVKTNELAVKAVDYVIKVLKVLKEETEARELSKQAHTYLEIRKQLISIKKYLQRDHPQTVLIQVEQLDKLAATFEDIKESDTDDILRWEDDATS